MTETSTGHAKVVREHTTITTPGEPGFGFGYLTERPPTGGNTYDATRVVIRIGSVDVWTRTIKPYFDTIAQVSSGEVLVPYPFYNARIRRAEKKAKRSLPKYR